MTRTFLSTEQNDLFLDAKGDIAVGTGLEAVAANCKTAIQAQLGEMMFAADQGMPTLATAWDNYNPVQFEAAARTILRGVPDVVEVVSFVVERVAGVLRYTARIRTIFGETSVNG